VTEQQLTGDLKRQLDVGTNAAGGDGGREFGQAEPKTSAEPINAVTSVIAVFRTVPAPAQPTM
jgi:hypothetical protein